jgi:nucleoside transporter
VSDKHEYVTKNSTFSFLKALLAKLTIQQTSLHMKSTTRIQLSVMMFLNFFVWGIWFVTMGTYLTKGNIGATGGQTGLAYGTQCLGAIIAPFIVGMIADRFFAAQKILGVLHLAGAGLLYYISSQSNFGSFYSLLLIYMIIYMPTLALVNAIALKQISNAEKQFSGLRVWGTIGWIVAGLIIGWMAWEKDPGSLGITYKIAAIVSALFGIYCFFLPDTPPPKAGKDVSIAEVLGLDALKILKDKNYLIFFIASILICIPLAFYYGQTNQFLNEVGMAQMSETIFLFLMPLFFVRFGIKQMLLIGMIAWILRYVLFSYGNPDSGLWMLYAGIILHGVCYDFFFVTGQIYTDQKAGERVRSSAQGLITLATYGLGMYIGFYMAGMYVDKNEYKDGAKFSKLDTKDVIVSINGTEVKNVITLDSLLMNKISGDKVTVGYLHNNNNESDTVALKSFSKNYGAIVTGSGLEKLGIETDSLENKKLTTGLFIKGKKASHNWKSVWIFPCIFALGVTLMFLAFFKNDKKKLVAV